MTWTLLLLGYAVLFTLYWSGSFFTDPGRPYDVLEASLYAALNHVMFALALSSVIWSHIFGTKSELFCSLFVPDSYPTDSVLTISLK